MVENDDSSRFLRAMVFVKVFADSAWQLALGIDYAHSKSPHLSDVQNKLIGRDGNLKNTTITVALVTGEDGELLVVIRSCPFCRS